MHDGVIKKIKFFDAKDSNLIGSIVPLLTPLKSNKKEFIYRKASHPTAIYFITKGRVSFFLEKKRIAFKDMVEGGYFGDMDIIFKRKRSFSMLSIVNSDFLTMTKQIFDDVIVKEYPEIYEEMTLVACERQQKVHEAMKVAIDEYQEHLRVKGDMMAATFPEFDRDKHEESKRSSSENIQGDLSRDIERQSSIKTVDDNDIQRK